jgi:hypothetical protein
MKKLLFLLTLIAFMSVNVFGQAIPKQIDYQGVLKDASGNLLNGDYAMTFKIYNNPTGGTALWSEIQVINAAQGIFNAHLGSVTPITTVPFDRVHYLGITVGTGSELSPRTKLTPSPYSFMTMDVMDNSITTNKINDGTITNSDISNSAAISISKISGDAGIEYNNIGSASGITTTATNLGSITINCPTSGYVLLMITGNAIFFGDNTIVNVGLSTSSSAINLNYARTGRHDGSGTLRYVNNFTTFDIVSVNAGSNTFYGVALKEVSFSTNTVNLGNLILTGIFIPKRY